MTDCEEKLNNLMTAVMDLVDEMKSDITRINSKNNGYNDGYTEYSKNIIDDITKSAVYVHISNFECESKYDFIVYGLEKLVRDYNIDVVTWEEEPITGDAYDDGYAEGVMDAYYDAIENIGEIIKQYIGR